MRYLPALILLLLVACAGPTDPVINVSERPWLDTTLTYNSVVDVEGNVYPTITIGGQEWMVENLRTTKYRNGDPIPQLDSSGLVGASAGGWSHYMNDTTTDLPYGLLYNGYTILDPRNVCPAGWHVPTDVEWGELELAVGLKKWELDQLGISRGEHDDVGSLLKTVNYWDTSIVDVPGTNRFGFAGLPAGVFKRFSGYYGRGENLTMWTSTEHSRDSLFTRSLTIPVYYLEDPVVGDLQMVTSDRVGVIREVLIKTDGYSIRCVKDQTTGERAWDIAPSDERSAKTQKLVGELLVEQQP
jgi:uncharacterized protein (TIGR02145 family)